MTHILCDKEVRKGHPPSVACLWLLSCFKKLFNRVAKILCFVVFLVKIRVEHLFFQTGFKQASKKFCWGFAFCLRLEIQTQVCCFCLAFYSHLGSQTNVCCFCFAFKSHLRSRTNVAADSESRFANARRFPRR